jgi:23S rRNA pseudouridine1911/1915/1917 synthase
MNVNEGDSVDSITISEAEAGHRLDKVLAERFSQVQSRTYFQSLIDQESVLLNGKPVKKRSKPKVGDEVEIKFSLIPEIDLKPEPIPLDIIFEDEHLLVVNKPAGMVVHPAVGHWKGTFVNALLYHCNLSLEQLFDPTSLRPGIVHRLDKDTTGLLIAAKHIHAQQRLVSQFVAKEIHKNYYAICIGNPGCTEIHAPIGRHPTQRKLMAVKETGGKEALTLCQPLFFNNQLCLVDIVLATGRTHQIRVHLAHHKTPVLGDSTYGNVAVNRKYGIHRQMLHAKRLRFKHPMTECWLEFEAPLPEDMASVIQKNKLYPG